MGTCAVCGQAGALPYQRYGERVCSQGCATARKMAVQRARARPTAGVLPAQRTCPQCGQPFEPHSAGHRLCSEACRGRGQAPE